METATATRIEIKARAKAFTGQGVRDHRFYVDLNDGEVLVWDSVAGHYTRCNCLGDAARRRIFKLAKAAD